MDTRRSGGDPTQQSRIKKNRHVSRKQNNMQPITNDPGPPRPRPQGPRAQNHTKSQIITQTAHKSHHITQITPHIPTKVDTKRRFQKSQIRNRHFIPKRGRMVGWVCPARSMNNNVFLVDNLSHLFFRGSTLRVIRAETSLTVYRSFYVIPK